MLSLNFFQKSLDCTREGKLFSPNDISLNTFFEIFENNFDFCKM